MLGNLKKEMSSFISPTGLVHSPKDVNDFNISTVLYLYFWRLLADRGTLVEPTDYDTDTDAAYDFYNEVSPPLNPPGYRKAIAEGAWNTRNAKQILSLHGTDNFPLYVRPFLKLRANGKINLLDQIKWFLGVMFYCKKEHDIPLFLTLSTMKKEKGFFVKQGVKILTYRLTESYVDIWGIYKDHFGEKFPLKKFTEGAEF